MIAMWSPISMSSATPNEWLHQRDGSVVLGYVIGGNTLVDVAVEVPAGTFTVVTKWGDSSKVLEGQPLTIIGYPGEGDYDVVEVSVRSIAKDATELRVTSGIDHGNSGSPAISEDGEVNSFGLARRSSGAGAQQECACFSEIPFGQVGRLAERRQSAYGIAFHQDFVVAAGGGRVWYVDLGSPLDAVVSAAFAPILGQPHDLNSPLWSLAPFIERPGQYANASYRFEWEREWRVPGGLAFEPANVAFLFIPEELHDEARSFFHDAERTNSGPGYHCPYLDPSWHDDQILAALEPFT